MSILSEITIDWEVSPRIITVDASLNELNLQDLLDTLRNAEAQPANMDDIYIIDGSGKEPLGGGVYVALTVQLNNAKVAFETRPGPSWEQCTITGGNLVAVDTSLNEMSPIEPTMYTQVVMASSSSATLIEDASNGSDLTAEEIANTTVNKMIPIVFGK